MILPIVAYGDKILRKTGAKVSANAELAQFIESMWETMYNAHGVGLAAPQVSRSINLFVVDTGAFDDKKLQDPAMKKVFINAEMIEEWGEEWEFEEGCLSIPHIRENVT